MKDLLNREKGSLQSIRKLWPELMTANFEDVKNFGVPVILIEGRFDEHVSSKLAVAYWGTIETPPLFSASMTKGQQIFLGLGIYVVTRTAAAGLNAFRSDSCH